MDALRSKVLSAKDIPEADASLKELSDLFFKENKYSECFELLSALSGKKKELAPAVDYYLALCRYRQLKYLEETQSWDEYFNRGNDYREDISANLGKVINSAGQKEAINLKAKCLSWKMHKEMQDVFWEEAEEELAAALSDYASSGGDIRLIREVADEFSAYGEKAKAKAAYKLYAGRMLASGASAAEIKSAADSFFKEGNLELAQMLCSAYLDKVQGAGDKEKYILALKEAAQQFSFKDNGPCDPSFAAKIYQRLEEAAGKEAFDAELLYARAFNEEKAREFPGSSSRYAELLERFPDNPYADEGLYKIGIITAYVERNPEKSKEAFKKLAGKEKVSPQVISAIYQLGLLAQWQGDLEGAKAYYRKCLERAQENFPETSSLAKERLREIDEGKPIEYNLKTFMDLSFKEDNAQFDMTKVELKSYPYLTKEADDVKISSSVYTGSTGCLQLDVQYLWSGHIGTTLPASSAPEFDTKYTHPGSKEINLVVVSPSGVLDRSIDLVDARDIASN